jgi:hypothetical protein
VVYLPDFTNRHWQLRRLVITKKGISFALVDHEDEIDFIPLAEVESIDEMCGTEDIDDEQFIPRTLHYRKSKFRGSGGRESIFNTSRSITFTELNNEEENDESTSSLFVNAFQIATVTNGYNSGRSYYLQADSSQLKQQIICQLHDLAKLARKKAEETTWFRRIQGRVRAVYIHWIFQSTAALLIMAVRSQPPRFLCHRVLVIHFRSTLRLHSSRGALAHLIGFMQGTA